MNILAPLLDQVLGMASDWLGARRARQQARLEADIHIERARATADIDWDRIQAQNSATSWKDEWFTILLSIPVIMIFIPQLQQTALDGFIALQQVPEWYLAAFGLAVAASFGYRQIINRMTPGRGPQTSQAPSE